MRPPSLDRNAEWTDETRSALSSRIADALERLAPPPAAAARLRGRAALSATRPAPRPSCPRRITPWRSTCWSGVERQKCGSSRTSARFAAGLPANHVLLWGVRGAGKSSLAKAAFMAVAAEHSGLRMVEIDRDEVAALPAPVRRSCAAGPSGSWSLCDDLSFEEGAAAAKSLKSALEGGVSGPPANVLFVATSNRRHLMPPRPRRDAAALIAAAEDAEEEV